jgi:hypothetical protein
MSDFSVRFGACMSGKNLPAPILDSANEVLELVHQMHAAVEALGINPEMSLGEFVAAALAAGLITPTAGAAVLETAEVVGEVLVIAFLCACVACLVVSAGPSLRDLFATTPPNAFVLEQLAILGVDVQAGDVAVANA